jgi:AcrR family transcriptional regulator
MSPADPVPPATRRSDAPQPPASPAPSAARQRIIDAALGLFARHGVGGTSFQMIADEIGVTKAAVYHQYNSKNDIVIAAAEAELLRLRDVVDAAEAEPSATRARDSLIAGMVDLAVDRGPTVSTLLNDPVITGSFSGHEPFRDVMHRLRRLLMGDDTGPEARIRTAMLIAAISGTVMHPLVGDLDDETLRTQLRHLARRFVGVR